MKKLFVLSLILILLLLSACFEPDTAEFEPGIVLGYLFDDTELSDILEHVFSYNELSIARSNAISYITDLPEDSTESLRNALKSKDYFNQNSSTANFFEGDLKGGVTFWGFSEDDKDDCLALFETYHMRRDTARAFLDCIEIRVPVGYEKLWVNYLSLSGFFSGVDLNWYGSYCGQLPLPIK